MRLENRLTDIRDMGELPFNMLRTTRETSPKPNLQLNELPCLPPELQAVL